MPSVSFEFLLFDNRPPKHRIENSQELVLTCPSPATDINATLVHISRHHLVSFDITLPILPKTNDQHLSCLNLRSISLSSIASCTCSSLSDCESFSHSHHWTLFSHLFPQTWTSSGLCFLNPGKLLALLFCCQMCCAAIGADGRNHNLAQISLLIFFSCPTSLLSNLYKGRGREPPV